MILAATGVEHESTLWGYLPGTRVSPLVVYKTGSLRILNLAPW
jgi:hypothetical protein